MTRRLPILLAATFLLIATPRLFALATEQFGNAPVPKGWANFTPDLVPVLDDKHRFYWYEVNGDATFFYKGDTAALNDLLKTFAKGGKGREVVLETGPLETSDLQAKVKFTADWSVRAPGGITLATHPEGGLIGDTGPAVHIYVGRGPTAAPATKAKLAEWASQLDSDEAAVRVKAHAALEAQGRAAKATLKMALETTTSAEVRRRVRTLLDRLPSIDLDDLIVPAGLTLVGPDEILARRKKALAAKDDTIRGIAVSDLSEREDDVARAVKTLSDVVAGEKHEYVRRCAIGSLQRLGRHARPALGVLKKGMDDKDVNVRNACKSAVEHIEKADADPGEVDRRKRNAAGREDLRAFVKRYTSGGK